MSLGIKPETTLKKKHISELYLVLTTALWGTTFIVTKETAQIIPPFFYMMLRFLISGIAFLPLIKHFKGFTKEHLKVSIIAGLLYFLSNATQTIGIVLTNASKASFITGLNVMMIPIFVAVIFKKKISKKVWISVILATIGIACLSLTDAEGYSGFTIGDFSVFLCAIFWAVYVIYIDKYLNCMDIVAFSSIHMIFVGFYNGIVSIMIEDWSGYIFPNLNNLLTMQIWVVILYISLIATCFSLLLQFEGQKYLSPSRSAVIFALEPVFATFFAVWLGGELINLQIIIGAILIVGSILLSIEKNGKKKDNCMNLDDDRSIQNAEINEL